MCMEFLNKKCIIRSYGAGVFYGTITAKNDTAAGVEVELKDARRIYYWAGANTLSQLAVEGSKKPNECKITIAVPEMIVTQVMEIIPASEKAVKNLDGIRIWKY